MSRCNTVDGKWHLTEIDKDTYKYENAVSSMKECGFDTVGGLYIENLWVVDEHFMGTYNDGSFSHNMEWVTSEALKVIKRWRLHCSLYIFGIW